MPSSGIEKLETDTFKLQSFQTLTGVKFVITAEAGTPDLGAVLQEIYELYTDYVLKVCTGATITLVGRADKRSIRTYVNSLFHPCQMTRGLVSRRCAEEYTGMLQSIKVLQGTNTVREQAIRVQRDALMAGSSLRSAADRGSDFKESAALCHRLDIILSCATAWI